jgi:hypothetical protein
MTDSHLKEAAEEACIGHLRKYVPIRYDILKFLPLPEAAVLEQLFRLLKMRREEQAEMIAKGRTNKNIDGDWFTCPRQYFKNTIAFDDNKQTRYFNRLAKAGYIKTRRQGIPAKRWIKVNCVKIYEKLRVYDCLNVNNVDCLNPNNLDDCNVNKSNSLSKKHSNTLPAESRQSGVLFSDNGESSSPDKKFAKHLFDLLNTHGRIAKGVKPSTWWRWFRKLQDAGYTNYQINYVLKWLAKDSHVKQRYTPRVTTAKQFYEKFEALRDAIEREQGEDFDDERYAAPEVEGAVVGDCKTVNYEEHWNALRKLKAPECGETNTGWDNYE